MADREERRAWRDALEARIWSSVVGRYGRAFFEPMVSEVELPGGWPARSAPTAGLERSAALFHFRREGRGIHRMTAAELFELCESPLRACAAEPSWMRLEQDARLSMWEVLDGGPRRSTIADVVTAEIHEIAVADRPAGFGFLSGDLALGRVLVTAEGRTIATDFDVFAVVGPAATRVADRLRSARRGHVRDLFRLWRTATVNP